MRTSIVKGTYFTWAFLLHSFGYCRLLGDLGQLWTWWKDQVKYFVSDRFAAASRRSGGRHLHACSFLHSFRSPAHHLRGRAGAHWERSTQTNGRGTPRGVQLVLKLPWFCNSSFQRNAAISMCFLIFLRLGKILNSGRLIASLWLPSVSNGCTSF